MYTLDEGSRLTILFRISKLIDEYIHIYNYFSLWNPYEKIYHTRRVKCYINIRTFYVKLLNIRSYKFYHMKENQISRVSPGGATF